MWKSCLAVEESLEESGLLIKDDFHYPDVSPLRLDFHSYFCCLLNIHDVYTSICPTVGGTLVVPLFGRVTENLYLIMIYNEYFKCLWFDYRDKQMICFRGRRWEPTLPSLGGGWLQLPPRLWLGWDLRHGVHQQPQEGETAQAQSRRMLRLLCIWLGCSHHPGSDVREPR